MEYFKQILRIPLEVSAQLWTPWDSSALRLFATAAAPNGASCAALLAFAGLPSLGLGERKELVVG